MTSHLASIVSLTAVALFALGRNVEPQPPSYTVRATAAAPEALLAGREDAWRDANRIAWGPAKYNTAFRGLWTPDGLYLRFDATDDAPWSTMSKHDEHLWEEEVVEIFLDPARSGRNYAELEINPANVVCDVLMREAWPNQQSDLSWNIDGLETRVVPLTQAEQTAGWTALAFVPWRSFSTLPGIGAVPLPPTAGDRWRFNVFRIKRPGGSRTPGEGAIFAAWSAPRGASFHDAQAFRDLTFEIPHP